MKQQISLELRSLNAQMRRNFENSSTRHCIDEITGSNGWIIGYLSRNSDRDIFQKTIEEDFGITRSTASKVVNLMVQKGLIEYRTVPEDARLKKLVLSQKAMKIAEMMNESGKQMEEKLTRGFSKKELDILRSYIERMKYNISSGKDTQK